MKVRLSVKLVSTYLAVGLLPVILIGAISYGVASSGLGQVSTQGATALETAAYDQLTSMREIKAKQVNQYFAERQGDMGVLTETVSTLRGEAIRKLEAVREIKRAAVSRYLQSIVDQMITFSEDRMIIEATQAFRQAFPQVRNENETSPQNLDLMRRQLLTYYTGPFSEEYKAQNDGAGPQAEAFFSQLDDDSIALQYAYIQANTNPLGSKHMLNRANDNSSYSRLHAKFHPIIRSYLEKFGYYDIFLCDPQTGDIVYSVFKELDYSTSLIDGPYAGTNFGEAFRKANEAGNKDAIALVDYEQYPPSYEAPASFIASPIFDGDRKVGVALFQMPIDRLNAIMGERTGLGETGETYLVGQDFLMRSDSFLDPVHHTVTASFRHPEEGAADTQAVRAALAGETGAEVIIDYNNNPVLSAYGPIKVGGLTWALLAEIDVAEAFCPKDQGGDYFFAKYTQMYGYYDLFLINPDGYCFYTVAREADYQTNFLKGPFADSGLGRAVKQALKTKQFTFADFTPYAPSNDAPAAFIAQPVTHGDAIELIVALQLSDEAISSMMASGSNKDKTLEAYLVGGDGYMRSNSILNPGGYSIAASFAQANKVDTEAVRNALTGGTGAKIITDYLGSSVLSAWAPLDIFGVKWALLCEIDEAVAMAAVADMNATSTAANTRLVTWDTAALIAIGILVALLAWSIARSVSNPLTQAVQSLTATATQVTSASGQVAQTSQSLAEGSSEQASSLEETSASLQELTSMTKHNTESSREASGLAGKAQADAQGGANSMDRMINAIDDIKRASDQTAGIVKTIEEIAFQTNLLALNAAVEAARAGEAGKGFAVVAEEVRNLAQRAAEAARNTGDLITGSVKSAENGVTISREVAEALHKIAEEATRFNTIMSEVATASEEQSQGIEQINRALAQMDQVTQQNAANSEEGASAAEELSAQAEEMMRVVDGLAALVGGSRGVGERAPASLAGSRRATGQRAIPALKRKGAQRALSPKGNPKIVKPEQVIPLDDEDMTDF